MSDIFISYSSEDREWARQLARALESEGWTVWWDRKIAAGKSYQRVIESEIDAANCVIVIWSEKSVASDWVVAEAAEGRDRNILVPVNIDDAKPPLVFRQIQTADLSKWDGNPSSPVFRRLAEDIRPLTAVSNGEETSAIPQAESATTQPAKSAGGKHRKWYAAAGAVMIAVGLLIIWPYVKPLILSEKEQPPPAKVIYFKADPPQIEEGESTRLDWKTENADSVTLSTQENEPGENIGPMEAKIVRLDRTTVFYLKAQGNDPEKKTDVAQITVAVTPKADHPDPRIVVFEADRQRVGQNDQTAIRWRTSGADTIELIPLGTVDSSGSKIVSPARTTTYELVATSAGGRKISRSITIEVACEPRIEEFRADRTLITSGDFAYLQWKTACAEQVAIRPLGQKLNGAGRRKVSPSSTTTYTLTARGSENQMITADVTITVESGGSPQISVILAGVGKYFEDDRLLDAVAYAVPLQDLVEKQIGRADVYFGNLSRKTVTPAVKYKPDYNQAKMLMREAGHDKEISGYLIYTNEVSSLTEDVQAYLVRIGIKVKPVATTSVNAKRTAQKYARAGRLAFLLGTRK